MTGPAVRVCLCPHPPLLLRELTGATDVARPLREACVGAVRDLVAGLDPERSGPVLVVGPADRAAATDPATDPAAVVDVRRFGTWGPRPTAPALPQSLGVGRRLLDLAGWTGPVTMAALAWDAGEAELHDTVRTLLAPGPPPTAGDRNVDRAVLLLGDGSARRGETAPGFLDERAFGLDDALAAALATGDAAALRDLDPGLARELMVGGRSTFRLLGLLGTRGRVVSATLDHRDDPFGVSYLVARWRLEPPPS